MVFTHRQTLSTPSNTTSTRRQTRLQAHRNLQTQRSTHRQLIQVPQSSSRLLDLPPELRNRVYKFLVNDEEIKIVLNITKLPSSLHYTHSASLPTGTHSLLSLAATCRQLHYEAAPLVFSLPVISFPTTLIVKPFFLTLTATQLGAVRNLAISFTETGRLRDVMRDFGDGRVRGGGGLVLREDVGRADDHDDMEDSEDAHDDDDEDEGMDTDIDRHVNTDVVVTPESVAEWMRDRLPSLRLLVLKRSKHTKAKGFDIGTQVVAGQTTVKVVDG